MFGDEQDDPYSGVTFTEAPADPSIGADEIVRIFADSSQGRGGRQIPIQKSVPADTADGANRVNKNTANTGVVAYKDEKGSTVLTNVAKDPITGVDTPLLRPKIGQPDAVRAIDGPLGLNNIMTKLANTDDVNVARELFRSYQTAAVEAATNLESQALAMASVKTGVIALEKELVAAEAADRSDPKWMPGIGDSPITSKIRVQLDHARGYTDAEAKRSLSGNFAYKHLQLQVKQAEAEMTRVTKLGDAKEVEANRQKNRKELLDDRQAERRTLIEANQTEEERRHNRNIADKKLQQDEKDLEQADQLTNEQRIRIQTLTQGEIDDPTSNEGKLKAIRLVAKNPDKKYKEAIFAEEHDLPALALKGNNYAKALVMAKEEKTTGKSQKQTEQDLADLQKMMDKPGFVEEQLKLAFKGDKKAQEEATKNYREANGASVLAGLGGAKKDDKITDLKIRMALDQVRRNKTARFINDVSSWESIDPALNIAARRASSLPGGRNLENTLNAYLVDEKWVPLTGANYITKLNQFRSTMQEAAGRHEGSLFGMPDVRAAERMIVDRMVEGNVFKKYLALVKPVADNLIDKFGPAPQDLMQLGFMIHNSRLGNAARETLGMESDAGAQE